MEVNAVSHTELNRGGVPIKVWDGSGSVPMEAQALAQLGHVSQLPFVGPHVALMPDGHFGISSTVGSVVPTRSAIIPAAVGVDIGCGMSAVRTTLNAAWVNKNAQRLFDAISEAVPHGGGKGSEKGNWSPSRLPASNRYMWQDLEVGYRRIVDKDGQCSSKNVQTQLGTLGGGNHFIEVCVDENHAVWFVLHSGSRGVGNKIGTRYIELAKQHAHENGLKLPVLDLAFFTEGTQLFNDYYEAVTWAQKYAFSNRAIMLDQVDRAVKKLVDFEQTNEFVDCHHNFVAKEQHFGENLYITRKGAVEAKLGQWGIIPGSMGARSFITKGLGNPQSFNSSSHGAGRIMARGVAKKSITLDMHRKATEGVICRKDKDVVDESPGAYKNIDDVMAAQRDLVEVVHTLKQVCCVKG